VPRKSNDKTRINQRRAALKTKNLPGSSGKKSKKRDDGEFIPPPPPPRPWTQKEVELLKNKYKTKPASFIANRLNRSLASVRGKINSLNLSKQVSRKATLRTANRKKAISRKLFDKKGAFSKPKGKNKSTAFKKKAKLK